MIFKFKCPLRKGRLKKERPLKKRLLLIFYKTRFSFILRKFEFNEEDEEIIWSGERARDKWIKG